MFTRIITRILPSHIKRLIFCAGVYSHIAAKYNLTSSLDKLRDFNSSLSLAKNPLSLEYPRYWTSVLWMDLPKPPLDHAKIEKYISEVIKHTPPWLLYGKGSEMDEDMGRILSFVFMDSDYHEDYVPDDSSSNNDADSLGTVA